MDIRKILFGERNHDAEGGSEEEMRKSASNVTSPSLLRNIDKETDPLEAVKCDPAVLEAYVNVTEETVSERDQRAQLDTVGEDPLKAVKDDPAVLEAYVNLSEDLPDRDQDDRDPLEAVKGDPAVLEAYVNVSEETLTEHDRDPLEAVKGDPAVLEAYVNLSGDTLPERDQHDRGKEAEAQPSFEELVMCGHLAALKCLSSEQFIALVKFVEFLRNIRLLQNFLECAFCKNNGAPKSRYASHSLKDWRGRVLCPVLRKFRCPCCGATGDRAHTIKYCPEICNPELWGF